ncbi:hypothetical protein NX059_012466 [Plenodomus lindquistii]|nr:hypothetical protein NX059_012466 [Plenodomus lindquistii]
MVSPFEAWYPNGRLVVQCSEEHPVNQRPTYKIPGSLSFCDVDEFLTIHRYFRGSVDDLIEGSFNGPGGDPDTEWHGVIVPSSGLGQMYQCEGLIRLP